MSRKGKFSTKSLLEYRSPPRKYISKNSSKHPSEIHTCPCISFEYFYWDYYIESFRNTSSNLPWVFFNSFLWDLKKKITRKSSFFFSNNSFRNTTWNSFENSLGNSFKECYRSLCIHSFINFLKHFWRNFYRCFFFGICQISQKIILRISPGFFFKNSTRDFSKICNSRTILFTEILKFFSEILQGYFWNSEYFLELFRKYVLE